MATEDAFRGTNIGFMRVQDPEDTPQRLQEEEFSGIDGSYQLWHGRRPRVLSFRGIITATSQLILLNDVGTVQNLIGFLGTLTHQTGSTTTTFLNCVLLSYKRGGTFGKNATLDFLPVRAVFRQLYW